MVTGSKRPLAPEAAAPRDGKRQIHHRLPPEARLDLAGLHVARAETAQERIRALAAGAVRERVRRDGPATDRVVADGSRRVEAFLHKHLPGRVPFPAEAKDRTRLSEWFDCSPRDLRRAFVALAKDPRLNPIGAFRITKDKIFRHTMLEQDKGGVPTSRIGRVLRERRGHGIYMDNNRYFEGINYKFVQKGKTYPAMRAAAG